MEFRFKNIDETRNYLLDKINNDLMSGNYKKTYNYSNYVEHMLILASTVTGYVLISEFASLVAIPVGIRSSGIGKKILWVYIKKHCLKFQSIQSSFLFYFFV